MKMSLTEVATVDLPASVARKTHAHLQAVGVQGLEGIALWAGVQDGTIFCIREVIIPQQQGIRSEQGVAVTVSAPELHRLNLQLYRSGLRLLGQIHSHPTHAYHSEMDDEYAIATALGSFSLVVPDFAAHPFSVARCATYRLSPRPWWKPGSRPQWHRVAPAAAKDIFNIVED